MTPKEQELRQYLNNPNIRAFLGVISRSEGTATFSNPYMALGGTRGQLLTRTDMHPYLYGQGTWEFTDGAGRKLKSTANGRYAFTQGTYAGMGKYLGRQLSFTPEDQDLAAIALLQQKGVLNDVANGRNWDNTFNKLGSTWVSFHTQPDHIKQHKNSIDKVRQYMAAEGIKGFEQYAQGPTQAQQAVGFDTASMMQPQQQTGNTLNTLLQSVFSTPKVEEFANTQLAMKAPEMPQQFTGWKNYYK